jgi:hypothetical protein
MMLINSVAILSLPHWLPSTAPFDCPSSSFDMSRFDFHVYNSLGLLRLSIALGFKSHILVVLHLALMFAWIAIN